MLEMPVEVREASRGYLTDNPVGMWLSEHIDVTNDEHDRLSTETVWKAYQRQANQLMQRAAFAGAMRHNGIVKKQIMSLGHTYQCFIGVKFRTGRAE